MLRERIHRFTREGRRFAVDVETCFCFECDDITSDVLDLYPHEPVNRIYSLLGPKHDRVVLGEVIGELEFLRATNSILPNRNRAEMERWLRIERGVRTLTVDLRGISKGQAWDNFDTPETIVAFLLGASNAADKLSLELLVDAASCADLDASAIANWKETADRLGQLSGKRIAGYFTVADPQLSGLTEPLRVHGLGLRWPLDDAEPREILENLKHRGRLDQLAKSGAEVTLVVRGASFLEAVRALRDAGFSQITLDLRRVFIEDPRFDPAQLVGELSRTAAYYADCLQRHDYFRLEPFAELFRQIHRGEPRKRRDDSGTYALAVDTQGRVVPGLDFPRSPEFVFGAFGESSAIDAHAMRRFDDVGSETTAACRQCWARNVCGGGYAAVHHALTGSIRTPSEAWCAMQREFLEGVVAAFNQLASAGVSFERIYGQLGRTAAKPSLFQLARAAFRSDIGIRPLQEADAEMLRNWESWNRSAYFLLNERAIFIGSVYEREMDATHPATDHFEMMIVRKGGVPLGLLKVRPQKTGLAEAFLYFRDASAYDSGGVARSLRALLKDAAAGHTLRRIATPAAPWEDSLRRFLEKCGFERWGVQRDALFTKGNYHDVTIYGADVTSL